MPLYFVILQSFTCTWNWVLTVELNAHNTGIQRGMQPVAITTCHANPKRILGKKLPGHITKLENIQTGSVYTHWAWAVQIYTAHTKHMACNLHAFGIMGVKTYLFGPFCPMYRHKFNLKSEEPSQTSIESCISIEVRLA